MSWVSEGQIRSRLALMGVTDMEIGYNGRDYEVSAYAPKGKAWVATGCHTLIESWGTNPAGCRRVALENISLGLTECEEPDCEMCEEESACPDCNGTGTQPDFEHQRNTNYADSGCRRCRGLGRLRA